MEIKFKIKKKNYFLSSDVKQFVLAVETNTVDDRTGKKKLIDHSYFSKIEHLLDSIYQLGLKDNTVDSFRELAKHSEEIKGIVQNIANQMSNHSQT